MWKDNDSDHWIKLLFWQLQLGVLEMGFKEIYCSACKEKLGRYNEKYFSDDRLNQIIANNHVPCIRKGHNLIILRP
jgi:hypothetical protein